jgi:hypothetical protein
MLTDPLLAIQEIPAIPQASSAAIAGHIQGRTESGCYASPDGL